MKRYEEYKDSGVEWIGEVPEHWESHRIDWVSQIVRGNTGFKKDELLDEGDYVALQYGKTYKVNIVDDKFNFFVNNEFYKESQVVSRGDTILISTSETIEDLGHTCYYDKERTGLIGGEQILLKPNLDLLYGKYLYRYAQCFSKESKKYAKGLKVFRYNTSDLKQIFLSIPTTSEQTQIAHYLDYKTTQIDTLIQKKERLIVLLEEERTALINEVVTGKKVWNGSEWTKPTETKDSGIEWLGEIPKDWRIKKMKYFINTTKGFAFKSDLFIDKGIPVVKASDIKDKSVKLTRKHFIDPEMSSHYSQVTLRGGDILISTVGSTPDVVNSAVGQIARVPSELNNSLLNQNTVRLEVSEPSIITQDFLFYLIQNDNYRKYLDLNAHGTANQASLKLIDILGFKMALPPIDEQKTIVDYIFGERRRIDVTYYQLNSQISLLKEYKTALISEVVTGKIDVRDEVIPTKTTETLT
jgi:type I restriction enzyme S subunit